MYNNSMEIKSLRSKRFLFYSILLVFIIIDVFSINYFSRLIQINNEYLHTNKYEIINNYNLLLEKFSQISSDPITMVKIKQHELRNFLRASDCNEYAMIDPGMNIVLKSENFNLTKALYLNLESIKKKNISMRYYYGNHDVYINKYIFSNKKSIYYVLMFKTDISIIQNRIKSYFIFKIIIIMCIIIIGIMLVRALEDPLKNISYIAKKLGIKIDSDNSEHITRVFKDSIEEIVRVNNAEKELKGDIHKKLENIENEIVKKEGLIQLSDMSSGLAHQINNNLASLKGMLQIARKKGDINKFEIIEKEINHLIKLTEKFLEFSADSSEIYKQNIDIISLIKQNAGKAGIKTNIEHPDYDIFINTDPILLEQIFFNVFDNTFRYADKAVSNININDLPDYIRISIRDCGNGFPEEILNNPYKPFSDIAKGYGLGIPTIMKIANVLNHKLSISNYSNGTEVTIIFDKYEKNPNN